MNAATTALLELIRADFLERFRRYSTLITIGLTIYITYLYLPPASAGIITFNMGGYRGIYNSAWVGATATVMTVIIMSLPGFYLVKNAIERDRQTGVGQILATTPLTKVRYTLGKALSNWTFLAAMAGVSLLAALVMQLVRAEMLTIRPWEFLGPYLLVALPWLALVAGLAVLFEATPGLRGGLGNVIFFFLYVAGLTAMGILLSGQMQAMMSRGDPGMARFLDPTGLINLFASMLKAGKDSNPAFHGGLVIGFSNTARVGMHTFEWQGATWDGAMLAGRLLWLALAGVLACLAALPFDRFDPSRESRARRKSGKQKTGRYLAGPTGEAEDNLDLIVPAETTVGGRLSGAALSVMGGINLTALPSASRVGAAGVFFGLVFANLRLMLKGLRWWWYVVAGGLLVGQLASPIEISRSTLLPLAWLWPLLIWSALGNREKAQHTEQMLFSSPSPLVGQALSAWTAGVLLALTTGIGFAMRELLGGQMGFLLPWLVGAIFIPSLALALGSWTGGSKAFEVIYVMLWYLGPMNHIPSLDFIGTSSSAALTAGPGLFLGISLVLLLLGFAGRWRQIQKG